MYYIQIKKCKECNVKRFQQDFPKWTSGNKFIDEFIQNTQIHSEEYQVLEWIPYDKLENVELITIGGYSKVYKAIRLDGHIKEWSNEEKKWIRYDGNRTVALKSLNQSSNLDNEFLKEVRYDVNIL